MALRHELNRFENGNGSLAVKTRFEFRKSPNFRRTV